MKRTRHEMAGSTSSIPAMTFGVYQRKSKGLSGSAQAASPPRQAAAAAAAAAATAPAASARAAASAAAASAATTPGDLHAASGGLLVEEMERREADVGDFLFTEREGLRRCIVRCLLDVGCRDSSRGCAAYQREGQSGGSQCGRSGLGHTLPLRSLLHP